MDEHGKLVTSAEASEQALSTLKAKHAALQDIDMDKLASRGRSLEEDTRTIERLNEQVQSKQARVERLEEKVEALQARNEALMVDKQSLLEKQLEGRIGSSVCMCMCICMCMTIICTCAVRGGQLKMFFSKQLS